MNWFNNNFLDDSCYPDFLFEWTIILFKIGKLKEAEKKVFQTFCRNTYLFNKFFNKEIVPIDKWEGSNLEVAEFIQSSFNYIHSQDKLKDFSEWLNSFINTEKFIQQSDKLIDINKRLKNEKDSETRWYLTQQAGKLEDEF